jgi:hypothetical protein
MMSLFPHPLAGLSAIAIATGGVHTCAITTGGGVKCWGYNYYGQLGIGSYESQSRPADMTGAARSRRASELVAKEGGILGQRLRERGALGTSELGVIEAGKWTGVDQ